MEVMVKKIHHHDTVLSNTDASNVKEHTAATQCEGANNNPEQNTSTPPMSMETMTRNIESTTSPSYVSKKTAQERNNQSDKSTDGNGAMFTNLNGDEYKKFCLAKLFDETLMTKLVEVLHENSSLEDFVKLINQMADGTMDAMNMSFLLCLDVANFSPYQPQQP